jgi:bacillithiol system protein YtxJ
MALKSFEQEMATDSEIELLFLDLIKFREISNEIAEATGVMHQSPQVLVIQSGKVLYSESHHSIDAVKILKTLGI